MTNFSQQEQPDSVHQTAPVPSKDATTPLPCGVRAQLWADAYMARLKQGNSVKEINYMAHHAAVEVADSAVETFDKRFPAPIEDEEVFVNGHCRHCGQMWAGTV